MFSHNPYKTGRNIDVEWYSAVTDFNLSSDYINACIQHRIHENVLDYISKNSNWSVYNAVRYGKLKEINEYIATILVEKEPFIVKYLDPFFQTEKICEIAVKKCPYVIGFIHNVSDQLKKQAIQKDPWVIDNIEQTPELCELAVNVDPDVLGFVKNQTENICIKSVKGNWRNLFFVKNKTLRIVYEACKKNMDALRYLF